MSRRHRLEIEDWKALIGAGDQPLPQACREAIDGFDSEHLILEGAEHDQVVLRVLKTLYSNIDAAGPHRIQRWQDGWSENLREFISSGYDPKTLVPKFVRKNEPIRLAGHYVVPVEQAFENNFVNVLRNYTYTRWFAQAPFIYEFGCGSAQNLVALAQLFPDKPLIGLDWAESSQEIIKLLAQHCGYNIRGRPFDLFNPDPNLQLERGSAVLTNGTLEQLGTDFVTFLDWLLKQPFEVCLNFETIYELYDQDKLIDYLAAKYLEKRNYLRGYLTELRRREQEGQLKILQVQKTFGSLYHDGYNYIVWKKL